MKKGEKIVNAAEGLRLGKWLIFFFSHSSPARGGGGLCVWRRHGGGVGLTDALGVSG